MYIYHLSHAFYMRRTSHIPCFDRPNNILWSVQLTKFLITQSSNIPPLPPCCVQIFFSALSSRIPSVCLLTSIWRSKLAHKCNEVTVHGAKGSIPGRGREEIFLSTPRRPDRLWDPPNLLSSGYLGLFSCRKIGRGVKLTTHLHLASRLRMCGAIPPLHGVMLS
jgi:hypothetical protein